MPGHMKRDTSDTIFPTLNDLTIIIFIFCSAFESCTLIQLIHLDVKLKWYKGKKYIKIENASKETISK